MIKKNIIFIIGICIVSAACGYSDSSDDTSNQNALAVNEQEEIDSEKEEENTTQAEAADTAYDIAEISYEETTDVSEEKVTDNNDSTAKVASESEENLLKQMPDLDRNIKEMVPTIESYIETIGINGDAEFTVANTELFWGFVLSYCNKNGHYTSDMSSRYINRYELEEALRAAFFDFSEIPDTLYTYSGYYPEYPERFAVEDNYIRMPGVGTGKYYILRGWEPSKDGYRIDVKMDEFSDYGDEWRATYIVHLQPIKKSIEYNSRLKFFITGIEKHVSKDGCEYSIPYDLHNYDSVEIGFYSFEEEENVFGNSYIVIGSYIEEEPIEDWAEYCSYVLGDVCSVSYGEEIFIDGRQALYAEGTTRMAMDIEKASFMRYLINIEGKGIVDIVLYCKEENTDYEKALNLIVETLDTSNANAFFTGENESVKQETENNGDGEDTKSEDTELSETSPLNGVYTDIIGDAVFYLAGEAGNTKGGYIFRTFEDPYEIFYDAEGFDNSMPTYVYIDGILNGTYQMGTDSGYLKLNEENRKEGIHKVDVIQYAENDHRGEIAICKKCRYQMIRDAY